MFQQQEGSGQRKSYPGKILIYALLVIIFSSGLVLSFMQVTGSTVKDIRFAEEVVVSSGDTLWTLARPYRPRGMDIREYVDIVAEINGVQDGIIHPGQVIYLPR